MSPAEMIGFWRPTIGELWLELAPDVSMLAKQIVTRRWLADALVYGDQQALDSDRLDLSAPCEWQQLMCRDDSAPHRAVYVYALC
mgnify:CR=1 FL=1